MGGGGVRATIRDLRRHPSWLGTWLVDAPWTHRRWWGQLLFESGSGWLRWGGANRTTYYWESDACAYAPEWYRCAPPIRRLALYLRQWLVVPRIMLLRHEGYRFSWEEAQPLWPSDLIDPERKAMWR